MGIKKCKCKNCAYGKQIFWSDIKEVRCEEYGRMPVPKYCDKFTTIEDYERKQQIKADYEYQKKCLEYVWHIVDKWENK